jgi:hypothetical protein
MSDSPSLTGCSISSEVVPPHSLPMIGLVKISTNWAGWAPEFLITLRTEHYEVEPPSVLKRLLRHSKHNCQPPLYGVDNSGGHLRGGVPIVGAHGAASLLAAATGGFVAHQLVNDPGGDAGVLQPGREGVPQVMRAPQVQVAQVGPGRVHGGLGDPPQVVDPSRRRNAYRGRGGRNHYDPRSSPCYDE